MSVGAELAACAASSYTFRFGTLIVALDHELRLLAIALVQSEGHVQSHGICTDYKYVEADLTILLAGDKVCPCCVRTHREDDDPNERCQRCTARLATLAQVTARRRRPRRQRSRLKRLTVSQT
jgi:hypothetical protein